MFLRIEKENGWTKIVVRDFNGTTVVEKEMNDTQLRSLISLLETAAKAGKFVIETTW